MYSRRWTPALLFMVLLAMQSTASNAGSSTIGVAASIKPNAEAGVGANLQTLSPGSELHASETVRTGNLGQADLVFIDSTNLTVGPKSEVLLDQFVYDPTGSSGRVVMQATRGAFRFVTGKQDHAPTSSKLRMGRRHLPSRTILITAPATCCAYAPTDQSGKNANARSSANAAYAQAVGRGAGTIVTFEVLSEEDKKKRRDKCDVRVKVEKGEAEFTTT